MMSDLLSRVGLGCLVAAIPLAASAEELPDAGTSQGATTSAYFRVDTDVLSTQFWFGGTHQWDVIGVASDIYVTGSFAEFDIGPSFVFGQLTLVPMVGVGFDFEARKVKTLVAPQLFVTYSSKRLLFDSWSQVFLNSPFAEGSEDSFYLRNGLLWKTSSLLAIGPQVEATVRINEIAAAEPGGGVVMQAPGVTSLPVGGRVDIGYGAGNTLTLFLGYDDKAPAGSDKIAGRFTFVRTW
jgi:hypothetical protein